MARIKHPFDYLLWNPPAMPPEHEMALARLIRREGMFQLVRFHIGIVRHEDGFRLRDLSYFLAQNYPGLVLLLIWVAGLWFENDDLLWLGGCGGLVWAVLSAYGIARYISWLIALLFRWPPMAKG